MCPCLQKSSQFLVFNAKFLVLNAKFIIVAHQSSVPPILEDTSLREPCRNIAGIYYLTDRSHTCSGQQLCHETRPNNSGRVMDPFEVTDLVTHVARFSVWFFMDPFEVTDLVTHDHRFSGEVLHYLCIPNRKLKHLWHLYSNSHRKSPQIALNPITHPQSRTAARAVQNERAWLKD